MNSLSKSFSILLTAFLALSSLCTGQIPADTVANLSLTLGQVWEKAEINNRDIQMKQLHLESSEEAIKDARAERLPEIEAKGEYARVSNMPVYNNGLFNSHDQYEVLHSTYTVGADAYLNIYNGNKVNLEIAARKSENRIAAEQTRLTVSEIKLRAAAYFLDMQRSLLFKDLLLKDIDAQEKQLIRIKNLLQNGVVLKSDVLRAELKVSRQKLALVQLDNDLTIANQKLDILIGLPDAQHVNPIELASADSFLLKPYDDYLAEAAGNAYSIKISEQESELRLLQVKKIKANVSPKVGFFATYDYSYPQILFYPYSPYLYGLGLAGIKASFSISSFYYNRHKAKAARLDYQSQEIGHLQTQDIVRQQVREAWLRYKEAINRVDVSQTNVTQATENRRIVNNTYFNQLSLITDLLDADTQLLQTRFDLAAAQIAAKLQYYQLENVTGKL